MPAMGTRDLLKHAVSACLGVVTAGCVAIHIPPPAVKVQEKDIRFLKQGTTTRDEVLQRLGQPNILSGKRFSVYEWLSAPGFGIVAFGAGAAGGGGSAGSMGRNQSRLLVEFDEGGTLRHFAFAEYHLPGLYFKVPSGGYFVGGSAHELPRPTASLLKPNRSLEQISGFWRPPDPHVWAPTLSRDGRYVAVPSNNGIRVWDLSTGLYRTIVSGLKLDRLGIVGTRAIDISRDGKMLAAAIVDAAVLWDMASGERLHVLRHGKSTWFNAEPRAVEFAPDGTSVATGGYDGTVKLWDVASGKETSSFPVGGATVQSLAFAPRGDLLAVGTSRGAVIVIDVTTGKQATILDGSDEFEWSRTAGERQILRDGRKVAFSPAGRMLAVSDCVAVQLWRVSDIREQFESLAAVGRPPGADKQHEPSITFLLPYGKQPGCSRGERTLALSPDEEVLIASSNLYSVWHLKSRRLLAAWDTPRVDEPADLTLGPGAALLAWNDADGKGIQIVDLAPIFRESMEGGERAGSQGTAK